MDGLGLGMEEKWPFLPPVHPWHVTGLVLGSHQGPAQGVPAGRGA